MYLFWIFIIISFYVIETSLAAVSDYKTYSGYKLYEIKGDLEELKNVVKAVLELDDSIAYTSNGNEIQLLIPPQLAQPFDNDMRVRNSLESQILVEDYAEVLSIEKSGYRINNGFSWTAYYDVDDIYKYLRNVSALHPDTTEVVVGGETYEGRQILGLRINTQGLGKSDEPKPEVFIESGIHAREWITPATTTYFINQLLTSADPKIQALRDLFDWHIFPTVNPDGYHYSYTRDRMWRKTRSKSEKRTCYGADPNRNWDYNWLQHGASNDPCDYQTYGGSKPFSEVETRTLSEYISNMDNLLAYLAFHADAQMLLLPYSDSEEHNDNYDDLVQIGQASLDSGYQVNKAKYRGPATAAEILYKASGGSMDWVRHELGTPLVYTYELRGTMFHWPPWRIPEQGDEVTQMILGLAEEARSIGYYNDRVQM